MNNVTRVRMWMFSAICLLFLAAGCDKGGAPGSGEPGYQEPAGTQATSIGNGFHLGFEADLSGATALTVPLVDEKSASSKQLLKVDASGAVSNVFDVPFEVHNWKETDTHIIIQGHVIEKIQVQREYYSEEKTIHCYLMAVPKIKTKTKVYCLSRDELGQGMEYSNDKSPRYDVRGTQVYFAVILNQPGETNITWNEAITELRHWDGVSESVTTLYTSNQKKQMTPEVRRPFTSLTSQRTCFNLQGSQYSNADSLEAALFCRDDDSDLWSWEKNIKVSDNSIKFGNWILTEDTRIDLHDLKSVHRRGPLPRKLVFRTSNGGYLGLNDEKIIWLKEDGETEAIAASDKKTTLVSTGGYVWYFGSRTLKRIALDTVEVEKDPVTTKEKNYYDSTRLMVLTGLSWTPKGYLRVEGIKSNGKPSTSFLTPDGTLIHQVDDKVKVEHPIEIQWTL